MSRSPVSSKSLDTAPATVSQASPLTRAPTVPATSPLVGVIVEEARRRALGRPVPIDPAFLLARERELLLRMTPAQIEAGAPDDLPAFRGVFSEAIGELREVNARKPFVLHHSQRYSARAKALHKVSRGLFLQGRQRATKRLDRTPELAALRFAFGVNAQVTTQNTMSVLAGLQSQLAACEDPARFALLDAAGMYPASLGRRLAVAVTALVEAISDGTVGTATRSDVDDAMQRALAKAEVALERALAYLEEFVSFEAAEALEAEIPHRRRTSVAAGTADPGTNTPAAPAAPVVLPVPAAPAPATPSEPES